MDFFFLFSYLLNVTFVEIQLAKINYCAMTYKIDKNPLNMLTKARHGKGLG